MDDRDKAALLEGYATSPTLQAEYGDLETYAREFGTEVGELWAALKRVLQAEADRERRVSQLQKRVMELENSLKWERMYLVQLEVIAKRYGGYAEIVAAQKKRVAEIRAAIAAEVGL